MREMKDSGIEWIGEIPINWEVEKFKYTLVRKSVKNIYDSQILSLYREHGVVPKDSRDDNHNVTSEDTSNYRYVRKGDFVVNKMKAWQGSVAISKFEGVVSPAYFVYSFIGEKFNRDYFHYLLRDKSYATEFKRLSGGIRVGQWDLPAYSLENTLVIIPPLTEQKVIADFLDEKCSEIDALTNDINAQIETLEQYKRSVITEAVTKGLDPDVKMKDSGIEWVGEIPESWGIHPLYFYFKERKHKNILGRETNLLSLSYGRVIRKNINSNGGLLPESFNTYNIVEVNDIVIRPTDLQNDKRSLRTGLVKEHGIITSAYIALKSKSELSAKYYHYLLHAYDTMKVFYNMGNGVRQGLTFTEFSHLLVLAPTKEEQQDIATFLDVKCTEIDKTITDKKQQLEILADYKKSLIYEYVTGKKEVKPNE